MSRLPLRMPFLFNACMQTEQYRWSAESGWEPQAPPGSLGDSAQMVLIFFGSKLAQEWNWYDAVRLAYPRARLIGCSASGQIQGSAVRDASVVVTAVAFEHTRVEVARGVISHPDGGYDAGRDLASSLDPKDLSAVLLIADGINANATDTLSGVTSTLPAGVCVFGGCASNGHTLRDTSVICDAPPEANTIAALGFYGRRLKIGMGSSGGWDPFGLDRIITKSRKNVLYELDGRPALPIYKKYIGPAADDLPGSGMLFPISIRTGDSSRYVLRGVLSVDEKEQSITFAGNVPEGAHARLMFGSVEHLIDGSLEAAEMTQQSLAPISPQLLIVVSCVARKLVLNQRTAEELECFDEVFPQRPETAGFYALGEIATLGSDDHADFHNETLTAAALAEV